MIIGNRVVFGYGTVAVGYSFNALTLQVIKPPQEIGSAVDINNVVAGARLEIKFSIEEAHDLISRLEKVNGASSVLYNDYVFDFSHYSRASVDVVIKHLKGLIGCLLLPYAC